MKLAELKQYFRANSNKIVKLLEEHSFIILEKDKIKILE